MVRAHEIDTSGGVPGKGLCGRKLHICSYIVRDGDMSFIETYSVPELLDMSQVFRGICRAVYEGFGYVFCETGWCSWYQRDGSLGEED